MTEAELGVMLVSAAGVAFLGAAVIEARDEANRMWLGRAKRNEARDSTRARDVLDLRRLGDVP